MAAFSLAYILATGIRGSLAGNISSCPAVWLSLELLVTLTNPLFSADTELGAVQQMLIQSLSMLVRGSSIILEMCIYPGVEYGHRCLTPHRTGQEVMGNTLSICNCMGNEVH